MKELSSEDLKKIIKRSDPRYDGHFYFGVKTTGIYCRPVCPAKPKPENILIFKSASEAENAGYRPCLRCRPDAAPGSKILQGTVNSVSRALRIIDETTEDSLNVATLADKVGMTDRHLRRLFDEHLGASPIEILVTKRLHLARQLILQTSNPITDIALAVGFKSIRRFNEAFKTLYRVTPSQVRKESSGENKSELTLSISVRAPFDWQNILSYLTRHETYGVEQVTSDVYVRFIPIEKGAASIRVRYEKKDNALKIETTHLPLLNIRQSIALLKHLFDTEHNPVHLPQSLKMKPQGVRIPGCYDGFEVAVSIILGQLVSTEHAKKKVKDLVLRFGKKISDTEEIYIFPTPQTLSKAKIEELGVTKVKAAAIRSLSEAVLSGEIVLSPMADSEAVRKKLLAIKGIGPWTVEMIAMRCLGDSDAFPANDLIVERAIKNRMIQVEEWASFRAYLVHCLWRDSVSVSKKGKSL
ncbi:DNA-3-methyladenine glycosylase 2 family protein [Bdellovibrio sp. BCCA]|uniref:DNA-3-methyladenine glycosylase 2 family protein n=1 Tax=Bdellovibrio sp. BCCA TaxID=3136281 RepID=UPI0030F28D4B